MGGVVNRLNNRYLVAAVTGLFLLGFARRFIH